MHSLVLLAAVLVICSTWTAGCKLDPSISHNFLRTRLGIHPVSHQPTYRKHNPILSDDKQFGVLPDAFLHRPPYRKYSKDDILFESDEIIPETFDARKKWPECPTIREIYRQGKCGSCWAVAAATTMTDRLCIHSNGTIKVHVSAEDLVCRSGTGCRGGDPKVAWKIWEEQGLVTGGGYDSHQGCLPYTLKNGTAPKCYHTCEDRNYTVCYNQDKTFGRTHYTVKETVHDIQLEIMRNGPVQASFNVYQDFKPHFKDPETGLYKTQPDVYKHQYGESIAGHSVRLLGWGVEKGTPYWLAANSWGENWGENGIFKFFRGTNDCGIESYVIGGFPKI